MSYELFYYDCINIVLMMYGCVYMCEWTENVFRGLKKSKRRLWEQSDKISDERILLMVYKRVTLKLQWDNSETLVLIKQQSQLTLLSEHWINHVLYLYALYV